jgi:hypothetical protein
MVHGALITVHAAAGVMAFVAGVVLVRSPGRVRARSRSATVYFDGLLVLAATTVAVVLWDWRDLASGERAAFAVLIALAAVMVGQGVRARRLVYVTGPGAVGGFVDAIGFTLIALFDGFVIVAALDLGAPGWLVAVVGVAGVLVGRRVIHRLRVDAVSRAV